VNNFKVQQRPPFLEGISGGCIIQPKVFDIFDAVNDVHLFTVLEKSEDCTRCCCAPHHSIVLEFKGVAGLGNLSEVPPNQLDKNLPTIMWGEREGCCTKVCVGCCVCDDECSNTMFLHAGKPPPGVEAGSVAWGGKGLIGHIGQPVPLGGLFTPTLNVMERANPEDTSMSPISKVEGPFIFGGCSKLCCDSVWLVSKMEANQLRTHLRKALVISSPRMPGQRRHGTHR